MSGLSNSLRALLEFSKQPDNAPPVAPIAWNWKSVAAHLAPLYGFSLTQENVLRIMFKAYLEAMQEPLLELPPPDQCMQDLLLAGIKGHYSIEMMGPSNLEVRYSVEQWFDAQIKTMLGELRCARVDWLQAERAKVEA